MSYQKNKKACDKMMKQSPNAKDMVPKKLTWLEECSLVSRESLQDDSEEEQKLEAMAKESALNKPLYQNIAKRILDGAQKCDVEEFLNDRKENLEWRNLMSMLKNKPGFTDPKEFANSKEWETVKVNALSLFDYSLKDLEDVSVTGLLLEYK